MLDCLDLERLGGGGGPPTVSCGFVKGCGQQNSSSAPPPPSLLEPPPRDVFRDMHWAPLNPHSDIDSIETSSHS